MQQNGGLINGEKSDVLGGRKGIPEMKWDNAILWGSLNGRVFSWELIFPKLQYLWNLLLLQEGIHEKIQGGEIKNCLSIMPCDTFVLLWPRLWLWICQSRVTVFLSWEIILLLWLNERVWRQKLLRQYWTNSKNCLSTLSANLCLLAAITDDMSKFFLHQREREKDDMWLPLEWDIVVV